MLQSLGLAASLAAVAAQAIMIPSTVSLESVNTHGTGSLSLVDPYTQLIQVGCPGCMFAQGSSKEGGITWIQGIENNLLLNISVGSQPETLELNGVRFYPPVFSLTTEPPVPYISQVPAGHSLVDIRNHADTLTSKPLRLTSWSFQAGTSQTVNESGEEILKIVLQLNALERQTITVPDITVTALKNTDAQLMLVKVETAQGSKEPQACENIMCKLFGPMAQSWESLFKGKGMRKGCHKRPHHSVHRPPPHNMHHGPGSHHDGAGPRPHHKPHHGMHGGHRHHHHSKLLRALPGILLAVFVPFGLALLGSLALYHLGNAIIRLVSRRSHNGEYAPVALNDEHEEPKDDLEKGGFADEEPLPAPPVYVEVEAKEVCNQ